MRVLGVDPGTAVTGWGVVERRGGTLVHLGHGIVRPRPGLALPAKLAAIHGALAACCAEWGPSVLALEKTFVGRNVQSAFRLGEVRGVAMLVAATAGVHVAEYSPAEVKLAIAGGGRAEKVQVERAVARELGLATPLPADAADALAVAMCHLYSARLRALTASVPRTRRAAEAVLG
jgi:crossover junction endodeoxyribonuclease RuvC